MKIISICVSMEFSCRDCYVPTNCYVLTEDARVGVKQMLSDIRNNNNNNNNN